MSKISRIEAQKQAQIQLETHIPGIKIIAWSTYLDYYLFHIEYPDPEEKNMDPYFSVDNVTGIADAFSVITDIKPKEFLKLKWYDC